MSLSLSQMFSFMWQTTGENFQIKTKKHNKQKEKKKYLFLQKKNMTQNYITQKYWCNLDHTDSAGIKKLASHANYPNSILK